jgi:FtsP/CotA-like multicopper oxidase with cupredoxin domain
MLFGMGAASFAQPGLSVENPVILRPTNVTMPVNDRSIEMLGFNGSLPCPKIRVRQNDVLSARLENTLDERTMMHLHGIRLPNPMDGVNVLTQNAIVPGGHFDYRFEVLDAWTFWYHAHYLCLEQASRGMFGSLIVEEPNPPDVDQYVTIQLFDIFTDANGGFDTTFYPAHYTPAGRIGDSVMAFSSSSQARIGDRLRLRSINPSVDRMFTLQIQGLSGAIVALDGMPLANLLPIGQLVMASGHRIDVIGNVVANVQTTNRSLRQCPNFGGQLTLLCQTIACRGLEISLRT